jgi:flagellin-like hook-associated protein FlgL
MRVPFNSFTESYSRQLGALNFQQINLQKQLSNGQRITEAHEDPAAMGRALSSVTEKGRIQTLDRNLNRAELIGTFTLDTLEQMKVIVDNVNGIANTTDGLTSTADYRARGLQVNQLVEQSMRVGNAQISGDFLFAGANSGELPYLAHRYTEFLEDENGNFVDLQGNLLAPGDSPIRSVYVDANGDIIFEQLTDLNGDAISDTAFIDTAVAPGPGDPQSGRDITDGAIVMWNGTSWEAMLDGAGNRYIPPAGATDPDASGTGFLTFTRDIAPELIGMVSHVEYTGTTSAADDVSFRVGESATIAPFSRGASNEQYKDFFNDMVALRDAYFKEDLPAAEALIPDFDDSQALVNFSLVEFGSLLKGLEVTTRINESRFNELEKLTSREIDIDTAETIIQLNRSQTAYEAALSTGSRILNMSLLDFLR